MGERIRFRDLDQAREVLSPAELRFEHWRRTLGLFAGPLLFLVLLAFPFPGLEPPAARLTAVLGWVLTWWITEPVPIPVSSLLGPALAVILGVGTVGEMFASFGDPIVFLFLGGFVLAEGMFVTGLDRRFAYAILSQSWVGSSAGRILIAFAFVSAGLSAWLSNTATTAMLYPIGLSVLAALSRLLERQRGTPVDASRLRFGTAVMLAIAWSSSIGGVMTPVGSPPNLIVLGQLKELAGRHVSFFEWMLVGVPISIVMLAILLFYLRWALPPEVREIRGSKEEIRAERTELGPPTRAEKNVLFAFALTVALWVLPGVLALVLGGGSPLVRQLQRALPESVVAVLGASLLFVLPVDWRSRRVTLRWNEAARIDWGTLLLFGGGLALGGAMFRTGLAAAIGEGIVRLTGAQSLAALTFLFTVLTVFLTDSTSNTAAATMIAPLAIAAAQAAGVSPFPPALGVALGASMAFSLPVSTPPNAIIYGSGCVPITVMLRLGIGMDLISSLLVSAGILLLSRLFGLA